MTDLRKILLSFVERDGIVYLFLDRERTIVSCSDNMVRVFGYSSDSLIGKKLEKLCFFRDRFQLNRSLNLLSESEDTREIEFRFVAADKSLRIVSTTAASVTTQNDKTGIVLLIRDITQQLNSQLFKDSFFNLSLDLFAILDFTGKIIELNNMWQEKFGFTKEELIKSGIAKVFKTDERMAAGRIYDWLKVSNESMFDYEMECISKTGETLQINWSAKPDAVLGLVFLVGKDFTEKKQTEQKLIESESKLSAIIENTSDIIFSIDSSYKLLKFNTPFASIIEGTYGFKPKTGFSVIDPKVNDLTTTKWKKLYDVALGGEEVDELIDADPPNENIKYEVLMSPIKNEFRDVTGVAVFMRDVTEKIKAQEEQLEMSRLLAERNRDLVDFSFIATHNLRAPASNLVSLLSLYDKENLSNVENIEIIKNIEASTFQLNETLADLTKSLKLREETGDKFEIVSLHEVTKTTELKLRELMVEKRVAIAKDFSSQPDVLYPKQDMESIFYTLMSNSIKFSDRERDCLIRIISKKEDDYIHISFEDNGQGIDLERYGERLFGFYQRFHSSNSGKGLGLYFLNTRVKALGGSVSVESKPGEGSKFTVKVRCRRV